jgi:hypothetical protein
MSLFNTPPKKVISTTKTSTTSTKTLKTSKTSKTTKMTETTITTTTTIITNDCSPRLKLAKRHVESFMYKHENPVYGPPCPPPLSDAHKKPKAVKARTKKLNWPKTSSKLQDIAMSKLFK